MIKANLLPILIDGERVSTDPSWLQYKYGEEQAAIMILEGQKFQAYERVKAEYDKLVLRLMGNPSEAERNTYERKRDWALRFQAGDETVIPLLLGMMTAAERAQLGSDAAGAMAGKILAKNAVAEQLISASDGVKRSTDKAIEAATTAQQIEDAIQSGAALTATALSQFNATGG